MSFATKLPDSGVVINSSFSHIPVLNRELIDGLAVRSGGHYLDATVGGGGHSSSILAIAADIQITAIDRDAQALKAAQARLQVYGEGLRSTCDQHAASPENRVHFWQGNFADYDPGETQFDGILADLGVSSAQFDQPERGFSFRYEAPLDMRMDQRQSLTAADLINQAPEAELADIFYTYGEERFSRRIARRIVAQRPFHTTTELAAAIAQALPYPSRNGKSAGKSRRRQIHPATRVFQALRIAVNQELVSLETFLNQAPNWLKPCGRIGVISFHSLEDRIVKHALRASPELRILTKKPILPQADEAAANPRSRSAKLRLAERLS
jgi:16S rRNA (cytosine1402-N4)-methyltransferase